MSDFLDEKRQEIAARLEELAPIVDEYSRLQAAAAALADAGAMSSPGAAGARTRRGPGRPRSATGGAAAPTGATKPAPTPARLAQRRAGRSKGSGGRAAEALSIMRAQSDITIPELAAEMGIRQNYLYRVLPALEQESKVERQGRRWTVTCAGFDHLGP